MKKLLVLLFFAAHTAFGQWFWQNPLPQNNNLKAIKYLTVNVVIAVGDYGAVLKSTDGGSTWAKLPAPKNPDVVGETTNPLKSISFINENTGWIVGGYSIFKTVDGGNTWQVQRLGINRYMNTIFFVDENNGYVAGDNGELYKTTDGGTNWIKQSLGTGIGAINSIYFLNATTGWISGEFYIARTTDGSTWTKCGTFYGKHYNIHFVDANNGFSVGQYGTCFKSIDGGVTWTKITFPSTSTSLYCACFKDANTGIVVGGSLGSNRTTGYIYRTTNGGTSWTQISAGLFEQLNAVNFIDANTGIAVGELGRIMKTTDGGLNWSSISSGFTSHINSFHFIDANSGYIVGGQGDYDGVIHKTTDGGTSWVIKQSGELASIKSVYAIDANICWVGGQNALYKTTNGGDAWTKQSSSYTSRALVFLNADIGISANANSISRTIDGGTTWTKVADYDCNSLFFVNSLVGYSTGSNSATYKTTDGGSTWSSLVGSPMGYYVYFVNSDLGFVAGSGVWKTTNGGTTWVKQKLDFDNFVLSVFFFDANNGIAVGGGGQVWNTTNGGSNWSRTWVFAMHDLTKVHFVSSTTGWIVGQNGTILKSTTGGLTWINKEESIPEQYALSQNYPNPFNPSTSIQYSVVSSENVSIMIYNALGQLVKTFNEGRKEAGTYTINFNGKGLSSGVYLYSINAVSPDGKQNFRGTKKMLLLK